MVSKEISSSASTAKAQSTTVSGAISLATAEHPGNRRRPHLGPAIGAGDPGEQPQVVAERPAQRGQRPQVEPTVGRHPAGAGQPGRLVQQPERGRRDPAVDIRIDQQRRQPQLRGLDGEAGRDGGPAGCAGRSPHRHHLTAPDRTVHDLDIDDGARRRQRGPRVGQPGAGSFQVARSVTAARTAVEHRVGAGVVGHQRGDPDALQPGTGPFVAGRMHTDDGDARTPAAW